MFTIHIGEREFQIADNKSLASEINNYLGRGISPITVTFEGSTPETYVGGVARLTGRLIDPLLSPHEIKYEDKQNEVDVTNKTDIIYSLSN